MALSIEQRVKYCIPEGHYQKFMFWMSNALFGRPNHEILVWNGSPASSLSAFLQGVLAHTLVDTRVRCRKHYKASTLVFVNTYPRTRKQYRKLKHLALTSNVILINPPDVFCERTSLMLYRIEFPVSPFFLSMGKTLFKMLCQFHALSTSTLAHLGDFLISHDMQRQHIDSLYRRFQEYILQRCQRPMRAIGLKEFLASMLVLSPSARVDAKKRTVEWQNPTRLSDTSLMCRLSINYVNCVGMFMWIIRVMTGLVIPRTILNVEDPQGTTVPWLIPLLGKFGRVMHLTDDNVNDIYQINHFEDYDVYIFDRLTSMTVDLYMISSYANVLVITDGSAIVEFGPWIQVIRTRNGNSHPIAPESIDVSSQVIQASYDVLVKEPSYIPFLEYQIQQGHYPLKQFISIDLILTEYGAWCDANDIPRYCETQNDNLRRSAFTIVIHCYFECLVNMTDLTICFVQRKRRARIIS